VLYSKDSNIALGLPTAIQSPTSYHPSANAVDGDTDTATLTSFGHAAVWWKVDLLTTTHVTHIIVHGSRGKLAAGCTVVPSYS